MSSSPEASAANFAAYTRCYDLLYRDKDYAAEAAYVAGLVRNRAPQARRVLELGCGTGGHAEQLARMGFDVHGIDLSDSMLARAEARRAALPPEIAARLSFAVGDARSVRVNVGDARGACVGPFDAVLSLFHVMSYQTSNADLQAAYATAAAHLQPGGVFVFDHWSGPAVLRQAPEARVKRLADEHIRVLRIAEPVMHWSRNVCDVNYTLLVDDLASGAMHRFDEKHPMRYLFEPELALLEGSTWRHAASFGWMSERPPTADEWAATRVLTRSAASRCG